MQEGTFGTKNMWRWLLVVTIVMVVQAKAGQYYSTCSPVSNTSINPFTTRDLDDQHDVTLASLTSGRTTLVVNLATFCGYTRQYLQMNAIFDQLPPSQFTILGFPSNQFGHQEPADNKTELLNGLAYVRPGNGFRPHPNLQILKKSDVNGPREQALYTYLKASCPQPTTASFNPKENFWTPIRVNDITWNFEKFLVSPSGVPLFRFRPGVEPFDLVEIINLLNSPLERPVRQRRELKARLEALDNLIVARQSRS